PARIGQTFLPGRRVGVARVDHHGADVLRGQTFPAPLHRRGADLVGRERPGGRRWSVGRQDGQVQAPRRLDARLDSRGAKAPGNQQQRVLGPCSLVLGIEGRVHTGSPQRVTSLRLVCSQMGSLRAKMNKRARTKAQRAVYPPSMNKVAPVMKLEASEARKT